MASRIGVMYIQVVFSLFCFVAQSSLGFILDGYNDIACGEVLRAGLADGSYLDSPGFPEPYPDTVDCFWEISAQTGSRIHLTSEYFAIEHQPECLWDYLSIEDGAQAEFGHALYCGNEHLDFLSESNILTLRFHSDYSGEESGFRIFYESVPSESKEDNPSCNQTLLEAGEITSPEFPENYPSNTLCYYHLQAPAGHTIRLSFTELHLEPQPCEFDTLLVYDGATFDDGNLMGEYCGRGVPPPIASSANTMSVKFVSDTSIEFRGFSAEVEFIPQAVVNHPATSTSTSPAPETTARSEDFTSTTTAAPVTDDTVSTQTTSNTKGPPPGCNRTITAPSARITSPGFPSEYPHGTVCVSRLSSDVISSFLVRFVNFTLEESENCTYDSVSIYPVAPADLHAPLLSTTAASPSQNSPPPSPSNRVARTSLRRVEPALRVLCGSVLRHEAVLSWEGFGLDIVFRSDRSVSGTGFVAETLIAPIDEGPQCVDICQNGGSCLETLLSDGSIDWKCACADSYTGNMCQTKLLATCADIVCHNGGVCRDEGGEPLCVCPEGFGGNFCEEIGEHSIGPGMHFTRMTGNVSLSVGSSIILECAVSDPMAHVMWLFHDRILSNAEWSRGVEVHPQGVLIIPEVNDEHSGRYTCMATTPSDLVERSLWLSLTEPCSLRVRKAPANVTVREGQTAMFECYIPDADVILWRKDGDLLESGARKRILVNKYLVVKEVIETDAGQYTCAARARNGCFSKVSAYLTVETSGHSVACGQARTPPTEERGARISMGHEAPLGSAPWHVIIREDKKDTTFCGGSLISADTVLTAAHCVGHFELMFGYPFQPRHIHLYLGTNHCAGHNGLHRRLQSYTLHERFNNTHYNNDIAVFKLDRPVEFTDDVMPICLETPEFLEELLKPRRLGVVTGCGAEYVNGLPPTYLNEIQIPYVSRAICQERAASVNTNFTPGMFCAGYPRSMRGDACAGDSGGPFVVQFHGRAIQAGIVSWGVGCDRENHYGYYTNLAHYHAWIMEQLGR